MNGGVIRLPIVVDFFVNSQVDKMQEGALSGIHAVTAGLPRWNANNALRAALVSGS